MKREVYDGGTKKWEKVQIKSKMAGNCRRKEREKLTRAGGCRPGRSGTVHWITGGGKTVWAR